MRLTARQQLHEWGFTIHKHYSGIIAEANNGRKLYFANAEGARDAVRKWYADLITTKNKGVSRTVE